MAGLTKKMLVLACLALSTPALATDAGDTLARESFDSRKLVVEELPDRVKVRLGGRATLVPGEFARFIGDAATEEACYRKYRRMKITSISLWVGAGAWFMGAFAIFTSALWDERWDPLYDAIYASMLPVPLALAGAGALVFLRSRTRLNRYETWYTPVEVRDRATGYNRALLDELGLEARARPRIQLRPWLVPTAAGVVARF